MYQLTVEERTKRGKEHGFAAKILLRIAGHEKVLLASEG
jgi:hypothetical protein